ncbi:MAG: orotate phosphoribosyltransferase [Candidatus Eisenbacteria bacterium]
MKPIFPNETERRGARARLRDLIRQFSLEFGSFTLASGAQSHFYLDLRRTTTHPEGSYLVGTLLLDRLQENWPDAAGGPSLGADPITGALAALSHLHGEPLKTFIVRSTFKEHGLGRAIEGNLNPGDRVVLFDDVVTQGGSLIRAARVVREFGARAGHALTILDRLQGGAERLAREGLDLQALFTLTDILKPDEIAAPPGFSQEGRRSGAAAPLAGIDPAGSGEA